MVGPTTIREVKLFMPSHYKQRLVKVLLPSWQIMGSKERERLGEDDHMKIDQQIFRVDWNVFSFLLMGTKGIKSQVHVLVQFSC